MQKVIIYTDGACSGNPGAGGWAALLQFNEIQKTVSGYEKLTTVSDVKPTSQSTQLKITDGNTPHQSTKFKKSGFGDSDADDELDYVGHEYGK